MTRHVTAAETRTADRDRSVAVHVTGADRPCDLDAIVLDAIDRADRTLPGGTLDASTYPLAADLVSDDGKPVRDTGATVGGTPVRGSRADRTRYAGQPEARKSPVRERKGELPTHPDDRATGLVRSVSVAPEASSPVALDPIQAATLDAFDRASVTATLDRLSPQACVTICSALDRAAATRAGLDPSTVAPRAPEACTPRDVASGLAIRVAPPSDRSVGAKAFTVALEASGHVAAYAGDRTQTGAIPSARIHVQRGTPSAAGLVGSTGDHRTAAREARAADSEARSTLLGALATMRDRLAGSKARGTAIRTARGVLAARPDLLALAISKGWIAK